MAANQGVDAERKVAAYLSAKSDKEANFCFERIPDAKSAGGRFKSQAGDFQAFIPGRNFLIEVKSVEHDYRLPHKNFEADQVGRMTKRQWAGSICCVLFFSKTTGLWRVMPLDFFKTREGGSWDLRPFPEVKLLVALDAFFVGQWPKAA